MWKKQTTQNEDLLICRFHVYDLQQLYLLPSDSAVDVPGVGVSTLAVLGRWWQHSLCSSSTDPAVSFF